MIRKQISNAFTGWTNLHTGAGACAIGRAPVDNPDSLMSKERIMSIQKTSPDFRTGLRPIREPLSRVMDEIARKVAERPQPPSERRAA